MRTLANQCKTAALTVLLAFLFSGCRGGSPSSPAASDVPIAEPRCGVHTDITCPDDTAGVMMSGGKMMQLKDSKVVVPMQTNIKLSNRAEVMMDGTVMLGGRQMQLKEGQTMMRNGAITQGGIPMNRQNQ